MVAYLIDRPSGDDNAEHGTNEEEEMDVDDNDPAS